MRTWAGPSFGNECWRLHEAASACMHACTPGAGPHAASMPHPVQQEQRLGLPSVLLGRFQEIAFLGAHLRGEPLHGWLHAHYYYALTPLQHMCVPVWLCRARAWLGTTLYACTAHGHRSALNSVQACAPYAQAASSNTHRQHKQRCFVVLVEADPSERR